MNDHTFIDGLLNGLQTGFQFRNFPAQFLSQTEAAVVGRLQLQGVFDAFLQCGIAVADAFEFRFLFRLQSQNTLLKSGNFLV